MKIPNINCKHYTNYGTCLIRKGWFFNKSCIKLDFTFPECDLQEKYSKLNLAKSSPESDWLKADYWYKCEKHNVQYPRGAECPKCEIKIKS